MPSELRLPRHRRALLILVLAAGFAAAVPGRSSLPAGLAGAWSSQSADGERILLEPNRIVQLKGGALKVWGIEGYEGGRLLVRSGGLATWNVSLSNGVLTLEQTGKTQGYARLEHVPEELKLRPATLGNAHGVPAARLQAIQEELVARLKKDQEVRLDPARSSQMAGVDSDNLGYIRALVSEVGWIDVDRFGPQASTSAFLLVQHSGDPRLMMAVLPLIEKDARRYPDYAQPYTLLYDRLQIDLGRKQRYGTQLDRDAQGNPFVLPLEEPSRVDEFLKELKLPPLSDYLATASKYLYGGKPVRLPRADE